MISGSNLAELKKTWHGTTSAYITGFILSIGLTLASYFVVYENLLPEKLHLIYLLMSLAVVQAVVQLLFFLHIGKESRPRWDFTVFLLMLGILAIIVIGSLWIMFELNTRVMPPTQRPLEQILHGS